MDEIYFAAKPASELASNLDDRTHAWFRVLDSNRYLEKIKRMWGAYHGALKSSISDGHKITFSGEQGELANVTANHFRNLADHIIRTITATRPAMQSRATNTDYKSLVQTNLANGLLDYYLREKRVESFLKRAVEYAVVMGAGYVKLDWNATTGEKYDFNEQLNTYEYEGDIEFNNLSPFDVIFDVTKETSKNHDWVITRAWKNRFDLSAKYPELKDRILAVPTKSDEYRYRFSFSPQEQTDDIPVYEFYHKRTESMPDGRYLMYLSNELVLVDSPLPYRMLPVCRISPADILGTPHGYSPLFDILPLQEVYDSVLSTIVTNNHTFGVQNLWIPAGAGFTVQQLSGGLNLIESNPAAGKPEALQLTQSSPESYKLLEIFERLMETISGVNSVSRGTPPPNLESGNALALLQSMTLQFLSGLQQSYVELVEDVGTLIISMLRDFASVPRVAAIVGVANRTYMQEFKGDDLSNVNRVIVEMSNPLARTTAGRVQMAEQMLQMNLIKTPEQYIQVINTGKLESMTDGINRELLLIQSENEKMTKGESVQAMSIDDHPMHIKEHKTVLMDPDLRKDPKLVQFVQDHILEHINLGRQTDPQLLQILGIQPLGPAGGSPAQVPPQEVPAEASGEVSGAMNNPQASSAQATPEAAGSKIPEPAKPAGEFKNLPTNAQDMIPQ